MLGKCIWIFNIFPFFVTTGGSLVWSVEHVLTKETLHKGLSNYLKELQVLSSTGPALGNIIYCLTYSLGTLWFMPIGYSASPRRNPISRSTNFLNARLSGWLTFLQYHLIFVGYHNGTCFMSLLWHPEYWDGSNLLYCCCKLNAIIWLTVQWWLILALEMRGSATVHIYNFL